MSARKAARTAPRIARVLVQCWEHPEFRSGIYKSLLDADSMIAEALSKVPPPAGRPFLLIQCAVTWTDGHVRDERFYIDQAFVADAVADGGVLRHGFLLLARSMASGRPYDGFDPRLVAQLQDEGRALLQRLEADPSPLARRNVSSTAWHGLSLLPDPAAAIGRLRARFIKRRKVVTVPLDADPDAAPDGPVASYPQTNHADVRYVTNYVSIALGNDLRTLPDTAQGAIWNHWHGVTQTVEILLRVGRQTDTYVDNEGLWLRQLPALVSLLADAVAASPPSSPARNAGHGDRHPYRVVSRLADGSVATTYHTARDNLDAVRAAAFYLGCKPEIVLVDGDYGDGWSRI